MDKIEKTPEGKVSKSSELFDEAVVDDKPSRLSGLVFFLLCAIPVFFPPSRSVRLILGR